MKFSDLIKKASQNLFWRFDSGCGLQLYGDIPKEAKDHVEYVLKSDGCTLFTLITPDKYNNKGMAAWVGTLGYETWVQFPPKQWNEMQEANAAAMTHAVKVLPLIIGEINGILQESAFSSKSSESRLNDSIECKLEKLIELAEKIEK